MLVAMTVPCEVQSGMADGLKPQSFDIQSKVAFDGPV
jgi:hypothetical protein